MKNKIYIAGKITGDECYKAKFKAAENKLIQSRMHCDGIFHKTCRQCIFQDKDFTTMCRIYQVFPNELEIVNPASFDFGHLPRWICMIVCLWRMSFCDYVYVLEDWKKSKGAITEHNWAKKLNKQIIYQS